MEKRRLSGFKILATGLPDQLRELALQTVGNCVACGAMISPLRARVKSERSRIAGTETERRLFYAPTCPTERNPGCSRTRAAQVHKESVRAQLGTKANVDEIVGEAWLEGDYRYNLKRSWKNGSGVLCSMMLNPSNANAEKNDPTLLRNIHFAKLWGFAGLEVVNPYAYRSPSPKALKEAVNPIGEGSKNDIAIHYALSHADMLPSTSEFVRRIVDEYRKGNK